MEITSIADPHDFAGNSGRENNILHLEPTSGNTATVRPPMPDEIFPSAPTRGLPPGERMKRPAAKKTAVQKKVGLETGRPDATLKSLMCLVLHKDAEVCCAAAMVLGRLRPVHELSLRVLRKGLAKARRDSKVYFLDALAATRDPRALDVVFPLLAEQGSMGEAAVRIIRSMGKKALAPLLERFRHANRESTGAHLKALSAIADVEAVDLIFERLQSADWEIARAVSLFIREFWPTYDNEIRRRVGERIIAELSRDHQDGNENPLVTSLRLAQDLGIHVPVPQVLEFCGPKHLPGTRRHALNLLVEGPVEESFRNLVTEHLRVLLRDADWVNVAGPALDVYHVWKPPLTTLDDARNMAVSRHPAVISFVLRELVQQHPDVAAAEITQIIEKKNGPARLAALEILSELEGARQIFIAMLREADDHELRRDVADVIVRRDNFLKADDLSQLLLEYPIRIHSSGGDVPLIMILGTWHRSEFQNALQRRAERSYAAGDYQALIELLQPVVHYRQASHENRWILGLANLHLVDRARGKDDPHFQRALGLFGPLARHDGTMCRVHVGDFAPIDSATLQHFADVFSTLSEKEQSLAREIRRLRPELAPPPRPSGPAGDDHGDLPVGM